jgi:hypothetical protein
MPTLDELEARLKTLLEVRLLEKLPGYKIEDRVSQQLAAAMHSNLKEEEGVSLAPNIYVIVATPTTLSRWHSEPHLLEELAEALLETGSEAGFKFLVNPIVTTTADKEMKAEEVRILASFSSESIAETKGLPAENVEETPPEAIPANAFLILGGTQVIPLNQTVINMGRRLDNQVVIDDPRISRAHAQLRIVRGRFVLFDLKSTGGTYVNGQRTNQCVLFPGDVISLAGVTLIFGQDLPGGRVPSEEKTDSVPAISADRPTAVLRKEDHLR